MNNNPSNKKPQSEIDIIALFEYFKNGIKSFFRGIGQIFLWIFRRFMDVLYIIYKNWILVFGLTLIFGLFGTYKDKVLDKKFKYEMVVEPQFDSSFELYDHVKGLRQALEIGQEEAENSDGIIRIQIEPIVRLSDEVKLYYEVPKNTLVTGSPDPYGHNRDTVFYNAMKFEEFQEHIDITDYPLHKISINSNKPLNNSEYQSLIMSPFTNNEFWENTKEAKISRLKVKEKTFENILNRSDSLLMAYARISGQRSPTEIVISGSGSENNVEYDVFRQVEWYSDRLENVQLELSRAEDIVRIISPLKMVKDDSFRSYLNPYTGLLIGFILALLILIFIRLISYLKNYKTQS